ncbi:hypothetical protein J1605_002291 [Eschrichtius robustus]|uniref:NACHT domain-containing protein n=1 Tax=Eschrichtius robustus TaxID=9764 RepID=A0AB34HYN4_ESCRO|nr:hypothetical protein J1605_002291 [Eschrichtius robustus]
MEPRAAAARELLLAALEDLSQERPWGRLEGAGAVDLAEHLIHFHGPERALEAARKTLKRAGALRRRGPRSSGSGASAGKAPELFRPGRASSTNSRAPGLRSCGRPRPRIAPLPAPHSRRGLTAVLPSRARPQLLGAALRVRAQAEIARARAAAARQGEGEGRPLREGQRALHQTAPRARKRCPGARGPGARGGAGAGRARRSDTRTCNRLLGRDGEGQRPPTAVLQGPAGVGKTTAARKILYDWAAGKLCHGQVDFAFFVCCREVLERPGTCSPADLILDQYPDRNAPGRQMLAQSERPLFILDGVDELPAPGPAKAAPCTGPLEAASGARVLGGLLGKALLPTTRVLVAARAAAPGRLQSRLCSPQRAEVRGPSDKDKKYFYKFFQDEWRAERASRFVKENETLFSLCFATTTSVYLLFIGSVLSSAPAADPPRLQEELRKLCRLACEGSPDAVSPQEGDVPGVLETEVTHRFIDQTFQEFLAALSYLLEDEGAPQTPARGAGALLRGAPELRGRLALTARFLFGPLNAERMRDMEHHFGCAVSERGKQDVPRWVQDQGQGCPRAAPEGTEGTQALRGAGESEEEEGEELKDLLELLHCLYETQEDALVHQALRGLPELALELATAQEKKKKSLMKRLQGRLGGSSSSRTTMRKPPDSPLHPLCEWTDRQLSRCKLPDLVCRDLSEALTELGLFHSWLSEAGLHAVSEGLAWPQGAADTQLPGCRLQSLSLTSVELSEQSLQELRAMGTAKAGLATTHPALDSDPQPHKGLGSAPEALGEGSSQPCGEEGLPSPNPTAAPPTFLSWEPPALPLQAPLSSKGDAGRPQESRAFTWHDWSRRPGPPGPPAPGVGTSHPARPARPGAGTAGPSGDKAAAGYFSLRSGAHPLEPRDAAGTRLGCGEPQGRGRRPACPPTPGCCRHPTPRYPASLLEGEARRLRPPPFPPARRLRGGAPGGSWKGLRP